MEEKSYKEYLDQITTFVFDVDGVLTDGSVLLTNDGELLRLMNTKDGFAMKLAVKNGYNLCIISAGTNLAVKERLRELGITDIYLGAFHKAETLKEYFDIYQIDPKNALYMGDDLPDLYAMKLVGLPACPNDAVPEIKEVSKYISHKRGGKGCVRDVIEQVLKVQGKWTF